MRQKDLKPRRVDRVDLNKSQELTTSSAAMSSPAGNDVYRSMVLAFRMSELQVGGNRS